MCSYYYVYYRLQLITNTYKCLLSHLDFIIRFKNNVKLPILQNDVGSFMDWFVCVLRQLSSNVIKLSSMQCQSEPVEDQYSFRFQLHFDKLSVTMSLASKLYFIELMGFYSFPNLGTSHKYPIHNRNRI